MLTELIIFSAVFALIAVVYIKILSYEEVLNWWFKFGLKFENKWFWMVFAVVVLVSFVGYAVYCTSRGYAFNGNVKLNWPKVWEMGIGCKPR